MLDTQYRMHPLICGFISRAFYGGKLADAPDMAEKTAAPWHAASCLGPFAFFNVAGAQPKLWTLMKYETSGCPYRSPGTPAPCLGPFACVNDMDGTQRRRRRGLRSVHRRCLLGRHKPVDTRFFPADARVSCSIADSHPQARRRRWARRW